MGSAPAYSVRRSGVKTEYITREQVVAKLLESQGGATQTEMAERIGVSLGFYHDTLKGRRAPGEKVLAFLSTEKDELCEAVVYHYVTRRKK